MEMMLSLEDQFDDDDESNPFQLHQPDEQQLGTRRSCVNSKVRWLMFKSLQPNLKTEDELVAAQWILCNCHKQLPYDRNWWSRMERQNGELSMNNADVQRQVQLLNKTLFDFVKQLVSATASVRKYIDGIDPVTNTLRKRDWNASTSLSEWISGDRGLLIRKLANNDPDVRDIRRYLPQCLCDDNLKDALHNGGILIHTHQFPSTRVKRVVSNIGSTDIMSNQEEESDLKSVSTKGTTQLNLVRPGAADTRMLDITLMDGSVLPVRRSRCSLGIPAAFVSDPVVIPKICVYDFSNGLNLYIFYRGHKMGKRRRPKFHVAEQHHLVHTAVHHNRLDKLSRSLRESIGSDEERFDNEYPVRKRQNCGQSDPSNQKFAEILPGVNIPMYIKQDLTEYDDMGGSSVGTSKEVGVHRLSRNSTDFVSPSYPETHFKDLSRLPGLKHYENDKDELIHVALSSCDVEDERTTGNGDSTKWNAVTSVPIQSVFMGHDNSTYLFNATLVITIAPDSVAPDFSAPDPPDIQMKTEQSPTIHNDDTPMDSFSLGESMEAVIDESVMDSEISKMTNSNMTTAPTTVPTPTPTSITALDQIAVSQSTKQNVTDRVLRESTLRKSGRISSTSTSASILKKSDVQSEDISEEEQNEKSEYPTEETNDQRIEENERYNHMNNTSGQYDLYSPRLLSAAAASLSLLTPIEPQSNSDHPDLKEIPIRNVTATLSNIIVLVMKDA